MNSLRQVKRWWNNYYFGSICNYDIEINICNKLIKLTQINKLRLSSRDLIMINYYLNVPMTITLKNNPFALISYVAINQKDKILGIYKPRCT